MLSLGGDGKLVLWRSLLKPHRRGEVPKARHRLCFLRDRKLVLPPFHRAAIQESESTPAVITTIELFRESPGTLSLVLSESTAATLAACYIPAVTEITAELVDSQ